MSYTNIINSTRTESHSIVPENKETNALNRIINAQGTGKTGSAIRKVANFIGMEAPEQPISTPVALGMVSVDFELEKQQWRSTFKTTAALEEQERSRRQLDATVEATRKAHAFVVSKSIIQKLQAPRQWKNKDLPVSRKFLRYTRALLTAIEEIERQRRKEDIIGENAKRLLARQTVNTIAPSLIQPALRSSGHLTNLHHGTGLHDLSAVLETASDVAIKTLAPVAESLAASAYQIGAFAARAAYFFGGKAAVNAQTLGQKAAIQGAVLGGQALDKGQVLGKKALHGAQDLTHKAVDEVQHIGSQAIAGAQLLGAQAQQAAINTAVGAQQVAINSAVGAQNLASQTIEKTKDLSLQAQAAANKAIASVHVIGEQAIEKAQDIKDDLIQSFSSTLSWKQLAALEEAERLSRSSAQLGSNRFALAMQTSALVKAEIIARNPNYTPASEPNFYYGTAILEETERLRRIVSDKASPVARINAKRAAAVISLYRQQTLGRAQQTVVAPIMVKAQPITALPTRYQAAM